MFDHVALYVSDFDAAAVAYRELLAVLGAEPSHADGELIEWEDFDLSPADPQRPVSSGVHVGFLARDAEQIKAFWRAGLELGFTGDGEPGPRPQYGADYRGAFLRDSDGNSIEACLHDNARSPGLIDHLWLRVDDVRASRDFYTAIAPYSGFELVVDEPELARFRGSSASFTVVADGAERSSHLHIAFPADAHATVRDFHAAALEAGARDHGGPGERPEYHPGYYGAFVLDPDGHNIEVVHHDR